MPDYLYKFNLEDRIRNGSMWTSWSMVNINDAMTHSVTTGVTSCISNYQKKLISLRRQNNLIFHLDNN